MIDTCVYPEVSLNTRRSVEPFVAPRMRTGEDFGAVSASHDKNTRLLLVNPPGPTLVPIGQSSEPTADYCRAALYFQL
jgi:hypothetical protein